MTDTADPAPDTLPDTAPDAEGAALAAAVARVKLAERQLLRRAWAATTARPAPVEGATATRTAEAMAKRGQIRLHDLRSGGRGATLTADGQRLAQVLRARNWEGCEEAATVTPLRPLDRLAAELDEAPAATPTGAPPAEGSAPRPAAPPPARPGRPRGEIWEGCPVKALGVNGATSYFLDVLGQLRAVGKLERMTIMHLFGHRYEALCHAFPQFDKDMKRRPGKFEGDAAAAAMTQAAAEKGLFDPDGAVRGVGAWSDDDGHLVYHMGHQLIIGGEEVEPTTHQGRIYPSYPAIPAPALAVKGSDAAAATLEVFSTWAWDRPDIDPVIMLGTVGIQMMGGALDWRPATWLTGPPGSGKSALQRAILHLHGGEKGLLQSADATARGIAALLGQTTLPVALDEIEPDEQDSSKARAIVELARIASSGGSWARGSSDQKGSTGQLRNAFMFSSVLIPGILRSQDRQRLIILNLNPFAEGAKPPDLRAETWRKRGAALKRLIIDRWPGWAERLELWRAAFAEQGITGRNADNWATTLAMADLMQAEAKPEPEVLKGWTAKVAAQIRATLGEAGTDADEVLTHLLSQPYILEGGREQYTVAQWIQVAARSRGAPESLLSGFDQTEHGQEMRANLANAKLAKLMLKVVTETGREPYLFVGNKPVQGLRHLFRDTQWAGGAWSQSLGRIKGARSGRDTSSRTLAGIASRGVEIPLSSITGLMDFPQTRERAAPPDALPVNPVYGPEDYA